MRRTWTACVLVSGAAEDCAVADELEVRHPLEPGTIAVAHKTLPCGTKLSLKNGDRTLKVAVIDRGPYVKGREFDLTKATAQKLRFDRLGPIQWAKR